MWSIIVEIFKLALPAMAEMTLYMLIWVSDTIMIGKYSGEVGLSALGISFEIISICTNILIMMGMAVSITSLVAKSLGGNDLKMAQTYGVTGIKTGVLLSVILSIVFLLFAPSILKLGQAKGEVLETAIIYFRVCSLGIVFNASNALINSVFRGCKNNNIPLLGALTINIINISLDYILIFGKFGLPALGVRGAAWATVTANICGFIFLMTQRKKLPFHLNLRTKVIWIHLKNMLNIGVPSGLQEAAFSIARLLNIIIVMTLGSISFSANQITNTIESLSFMPGWGISISCMALVGYSLGEKNIEKAKTYTFYSMVIAIGIMGMVGLIFLLFPNFLTSLFIKKSDAEVIALGASCLFIAAFEQIPMAIGMVLEGGFKGSGDAKTPFKIVVCISWFIRLPLIWYFIYVLRRPLTYFWIITAATWLLQSGIFIFLYKKRGYSQSFQ